MRFLDSITIGLLETKVSEPDSSLVLDVVDIRTVKAVYPSEDGIVPIVTLVVEPTVQTTKVSVLRVATMPSVPFGVEDGSEERSSNRPQGSEEGTSYGTNVDHTTIEDGFPACLGIDEILPSPISSEVEVAFDRFRNPGQNLTHHAKQLGDVQVFGIDSGEDAV